MPGHGCQHKELGDTYRVHRRKVKQPASYENSGGPFTDINNSSKNSRLGTDLPKDIEGAYITPTQLTDVFARS